MAYESIIYKREGSIARIWLNRPERANVLTFEGGMTGELYRALHDAEEDDDVKVVILAGMGNGFCGGHDLRELGTQYGMTGKPGERRPSQRIRLKHDSQFAERQRWLFLFPKLTIAQVHGYCLGEGALLSLACDMSIVAEDTQIGFNDQRMGHAGGNAPHMPALVLSVGLKRALELVLLGKVITGKEAAEIGLVTRAVALEKLEAETTNVAEALCALPRDGIAIGKAYRRLMYESMGVMSGFAHETVTHSLFTNIRWEPDENNFLKSQRDLGTKEAFRKRDDLFTRDGQNERG